MNITDLVYSIHPIDISQDEVERRAVPDGADLEDFVRQLISSPLLENENRRFHWPSNTALVPKHLKDMVSDSNEFEDATQALAERLHEKERDAQKRVARLDVQVQKGSLIQMLFKRDGVPHVLLVKVHLTQFLGEADYRRTDGYPFENTVLKMCLINFNGDSAPVTVAVADTNAQLAEYWWKEFLELTELTTNEFNTKTAFNSVEALLARRLKKDYRADYYQLRNNLVGYFRTKKHYNHTKMLDYVFGDYAPVAGKVDIAELRKAAKELPGRHKFDAAFGIDSKCLDKRRRTVIPLTEQIDLELKDAVDNLRETIRSAALEDGTQGVFIRSADGFHYFSTAAEAVKVVNE